MKKVAYGIGMVILLFVGCSNDSLVDYDKDELNEAIDNLSFNPEIPTLQPFEPADSTIDFAANEHDILYVAFRNEEQDEITFTVGVAENVFDFTTEHVTLEDGTEGTYGEENQIKMVRWEKDDLYYELFVDGDAFSKETVLDIAESYEQVK